MSSSYLERAVLEHDLPPRNPGDNKRKIPDANLADASLADFKRKRIVQTELANKYTHVSKLRPTLVGSNQCDIDSLSL